MKLGILCVILLCVASCQSMIDGQIQQNQKKQLDFEKADQDFEQSFKEI